MKIPRKPLISLCMIVKNEAETLARCLKSVRGAADELIIVDTGSTDATISIALSFGARVIPFPWNGDFAAARNAGLAKARGSWVLVLDADEELDPGSKGELLVCAGHLEYEAFFVRIHNHKGTDRASQTLTVNPILRMFRNRPKYRFNGIIHEQIASVIVQETPAAAMHLSTVVVHHYGYADGVVEKKDKISRNIALLKEQLELNPGDAFHHFNMAVEYMRLGEYSLALRHIRTSLEAAEPDMSYTHLLYKYEIRCLAGIGDLAAALEACERGSALFPDYPDLQHMKGALLLQASALSEAKAALRRALATGASPPAYHTETGIGTYLTQSLLGQVCQQLGEESEAIVCFTRAAQLHPEPWPLLARLLRQLKCAGREGEITSWLTDHLPGILAEERPGLMRLLVREGCYTAALELLGGEVSQAAERAVGESGAGVPEAGESADDVPEAGLRMVEEHVNDLTEAKLLAAGKLTPGVRYGERQLADKRTVEPASSPEASLLRLLQQVEASPAAQLEVDDIAALLRHPEMVQSNGTAADGETAAIAPSIIRVQSWLAIADKVLAELPATSPYSPAAGRVRLTLPLPRLAD